MLNLFQHLIIQSGSAGFPTSQEACGSGGGRKLEVLSARHCGSVAD